MKKLVDLFINYFLGFKDNFTSGIIHLDNIGYILYNKNTAFGGVYMSFSVEYYELENGNCPVEDFILEQNNKMQAKIFKNLELLENRGNELREPFSKHIEDGIFELRSKVSNDITRIFYFFVIGQKIILTNGFVKKTQKTPKSEIELAKKYRNDYLNREEN